MPASKSHLNRLLLAQSYSPYLKVNGDSQCEDVRLFRQGVIQLLSERPPGQPCEIQVGSGGTVLRFLALRASRMNGEFILRGEPGLFSRPQQELIKILRQLGVESELGSDFLKINTQGWRLQGDTLLVPFQRSSQFASAVLLNAWGLPMELFVSLGGQKVSEGYWRMSVKVATELGMKIDFWDGDFRVPRAQKITAHEASAEMDVSSAFALAGLAAVGGSASFTGFPQSNLQPDMAFIPILKSMGVPVTEQGTNLKVERAPHLTGVAVDLKNSPDLFPVLAALCALAEGESQLYGAPHLVHKESDRLHRMADMVRAFGRTVAENKDGITIFGDTPKPQSSPVTVDCEGDHRLAFAAAVFRQAGWNVQIENPDVVEKSFPEFWTIAGSPR